MLLWSDPAVLRLRSVEMDTLVDGLTYVFVLGAFVPLSAVVKPWGPFKRRWIGGVAALLAFIVGGMLIVMPPERPAAIAQAEWDRRIALCREHADGQFRDCVRDTAELKKAEQRADESKRAKLAEKSVSAAAVAGASAGWRWYGRCLFGPAQIDPRRPEQVDVTHASAELFGMP